MSDRDRPPREEAPTGGEGSECDVQELIARGQRLVDSPRPWDGYPLEWHAEAWLVGDLAALAAVALLRRDEK
jgi:hypothetical protein